MVFSRKTNAVLFIFFVLVFSASARAKVLFSSSGTYAFPVAGDVKDMVWTHYHWNGGNAVDILPSSRLKPQSEAFQSFEHATVVAVVSGTVQPADNERGGTALFLFGDDGREYYYAHLSSTTITGRQRVRAGEPLGVIGHTGRWAQYIEIHLHFSIASKWHKGFYWKNDVNAAEWLEKTFGLPWIDQNPITYAAAMPHGSPLKSPYKISESFAQTKRKNPDTASIWMSPLATGDVPVYATLSGEVRVMRATVFGLRLQITNLHSGQTVVYSGLTSTHLRTGNVVNPGQIVGRTQGPINYMYFDRGVLHDPTASLERAPAASVGNLLN